MQHQVNHCQVNHVFATGRKRFIVLAQPPILTEPAEGAFHDPTFGQHHEAMQVTTFDDFNDPPKCVSGPIKKCPCVTSVNPDTFHPPKSTTQFFQNQPPAVTILDISGVHHHDQDQAKGVNEKVSFASQNLLSSVVTTAPPFSAVLTLWLSRIAALGVGLRSAFRRTRSRSRS